MVEAKFEAGECNEINIFDALDPITEAFKDNAEAAGESNEEPSFATAEELAFIESVQEYGALNMIKALKLETFNKRQMLAMADMYAERR